MTAASPVEHPPLTPSFCFSTSALREFLRLSRSAIDDSISQHLSTLARPPNFDPSSTSARIPSHRLIENDKVNAFLSTTLYPTWSSRSQVLAYCTTVATSPDPDSPDRLEVLAERVDDRLDENSREKVMNDRLDPYSARYLPRETRTEMLAGLLRNERTVEVQRLPRIHRMCADMLQSIVRDRTWGTIQDRSADGRGGKDWRDEFVEWERAHGKL